MKIVLLEEDNVFFSFLSCWQNLEKNEFLIIIPRKTVNKNEFAGCLKRKTNTDRRRASRTLVSSGNVICMLKSLF